MPADALTSRRSVRAAVVVVGLAVVAKIASAPGQSFFLAVFVEDLLRDTDLSRTLFSGLYAGATVVSATMVLGIGRAIDRVGPGVVWVAVAAGLAIACFTLSIAGGVILVLVALCFMRGFGQGSFPLLGTILVASNFEARRGRAMAIATQGITVAAVVLPALAAGMIAAFGWRSALQIVAVTILIAILPLGLIARRFGGTASQSKPAVGSAPASNLRRSGVPTLLVVMAAAPLVSTALVIHSVSLLGSAGLSAGQAAFTLSAMAACIALGAIAGGLIADRFDVRWSLVAIGIALVCATGMMLPGVAPLAFAGFLALGIAQGLGSTVGGTVWAKAYGTAALGKLQGMSSSAQIAGAAVGPLVLALSASLSGGYVAGLAVLGALSVGALVLGWRWQIRPAHAATTPITQPRLAGELA